jgi:serine-type D-Ala-D-Ala carboxypeptidase/endopeptidase
MYGRMTFATRHSGLPRMPSNFKPKDMKNPYADYTPADLYAFLAKQGVGKPAKTGFLYSNLGFGLLGQALALHAGLSYEALLKQQVIYPLGLRDTTISLSAEQQARFAQGHDADHQPANAWDLGSLEGAGAIRSTADNMLTYLEANLHPDAVKVAPQTGPVSTLGAAFKLQDELRADVGGGGKIGFAWLWDSELKSYWHNGGTGGFSSYAFFSPECDCAGVVLFNTGPNGFMDKLGKHIQQRFMGQQALSLSD